MTAFFNYYETTVTRQVFPKARGIHEADVCIVGGGIAGITTALELSKAGISCVVLEARKFGGCASGMNGGQVIRGFAPPISDVEKNYGIDLTRQLFELATKGVDKVFENIQKYSISCQMGRGQITAAVHPTHFDAMRQEAETLTKVYGYSEVKPLEREELLKYVTSTKYAGGLRDPRGGQINPLAYTLGIASAATACGARLFELSPVVKMQKQAERWQVETPGGSVLASRVVVACNAFNGDLERQLAPGVLKIGTYQLATRPLESDETILIGSEPIFDTHTFNHYFRKTEDNRLLFGCSVGTSQNPSQSDLRHIKLEIAKVFPKLENIEIDYVWGGWLDVTANQMPDIREVKDGRIILQGFNGHGVNCASMAGSLAAEKLLGINHSFDLFANIKHQRLPGLPWTRLPLAMAGKFKYYLASKLTGH
ncbi:MULTISPECIES: NAD(P)/FAD-dependent oxidoreductase [Pseudomonas]|uniref:NAD(P)/FAD-dependent oxidoreductase n=1 Tax=Pseudomonas TaxID=286 RepID=UPI00069F8472|nr:MULTISPECIES: FAD-binding oxidoreductase [Pseudomonas]TCV66183.1 gamma-glutamylputrescine oxidase [Pseudomonas fluorescens]